MNNEVRICKCCGKEIFQESTAKSVPQSEKREQVGKLILECIAGIGSLDLMFVLGVLRKKVNKYINPASTRFETWRGFGSGDRV